MTKLLRASLVGLTLQQAARALDSGVEKNLSVWGVSEHEVNEVVVSSDRHEQGKSVMELQSQVRFAAKVYQDRLAQAVRLGPRHDKGFSLTLFVGLMAGF